MSNQLILDLQLRLKCQKLKEEQIKAENEKLLALIEYLKSQNKYTQFHLHQTKTFLCENECVTPAIQSANFDNIEKNQIFSIDGDIQAGKTKTMLAYILLAVVSNLKTIVVVRNVNEDCSQFLDASFKLLKRHAMYFKSALNYDVNEKCVDVKNIKQWVYDSDTNILVVMANTSQLKNLRKNLDRMQNCNFALFIDEADQLLHTAESIGTKADMNVKESMKDLVEQSKCTYLISATNYNNYFNPGIYVNHIIKVPKHPNYRGIHDIIFEDLEMPNVKDSSILKKSPRLVDVINNLSTRILYPNHPTILLAKCSNLVSHQDEIITFISNSEYAEIWDGISFNGNGITLYSHKFIEQATLTIDNITSTCVKPGIFKFKNIGIMKALSFLKTFNSERIIITSGMLAGRCINFMDDVYDWHITDEYIDPSNTATIDNVIQSLRICGIHQNQTPLTVWCSKQIRLNICKTHFNLTHYILNMKDDDADVFEVLKKTVIHKEKLGDKKICKMAKPYKVTTKSKLDNMSEHSNIIIDDVNDIDEIGDNDVKNYELNGLKNVKKSYKNQTGIVYKIIKMFIDNNFKALSKEELDKCGNENTITISNYIEWNSHGFYKIVEQTKSGKYIITTQIIEYLNLIE
jgi:hypothetical protein